MSGLQFAGWLGLAYFAGLASAAVFEYLAHRKLKRRGVAP